MLHRLSLYHAKVHNVGDESECLIVILQGMAIDARQNIILFEMGNAVFYPDPDSSLLLVCDFLRSGKLGMTSMTLEGNRNCKIVIIFLNTLIPIINIKRGIIRNQLW